MKSMFTNRFWLAGFWLSCLFSSIYQQAYTQCINTTQFPASVVLDITSTTWTTSEWCTFAGEYVAFNVVSGNTYHFSTCSLDGAILPYSYDTQLTLTDASNNVLDYSDDLADCGNRSRVIWTATFTGIVRLHINQYNCQSISYCNYVAYRYDSYCNSNVQYPAEVVTISNDEWQQSPYCNYAGEYMVFNITAGYTYHFSTCEADGAIISNEYDTQLTLRDPSGNVLAYSDDLLTCGSKSRISWTATYTGLVQLHLSQYDCQSNSICTYLAYKAVSGCQSITQYPTNTLTPVNTWQSVACAYGGEYSVYSVTDGHVYTWTTCNNTTPDDFDTQLTLTNDLNQPLEYSDDDCDGNKSFIEWTANFTGIVRLHTSIYNCQTNSSCIEIGYYGHEATYDVVVNANPSAGGTVSGGGTFDWNASVTVNATPNAGWTFTNWTAADGSIVSTSPAYNFTLWGDAVFTANFTQTAYQVSTTPIPAAGGVTTGDGAYPLGTTATITATPNPGWQFDGWYWANIFYSANPVYSFEVTGQLDWVAQFSQVVVYNVSVSASPSAGGTVSGGGNYNAGATATVTATPNTGWTFNSWQSNGSTVSTNPAYTFTVSGNANLVASFTQETYQISISVTPSDGGTVTGGGTYSFGNTAVLSATPNSNYSFDGWFEGGVEVNTSAAYSFTVTAPRSLEARFDQITAAKDPGIDDPGIYPNPTSGIFFIDLSGCQLCPESVEVWSPQGTLICRQFVAEDMSIDISQYSAGVYLVKLLDQQNQQLKVQKLIKF